MSHPAIISITLSEDLTFKSVKDLYKTKIALYLKTQWSLNEVKRPRNVQRFSKAKAYVVKLLNCTPALFSHKRRTEGIF